MVGVVQTQLAARFLELSRRQAFQRCLRGYGHEHREPDGAMGQKQRRGASLGRLARNQSL